MGGEREVTAQGGGGVASPVRPRRRNRGGQVVQGGKHDPAAGDVAQPAQDLPNPAQGVEVAGGAGAAPNANAGSNRLAWNANFESLVRSSLKSLAASGSLPKLRMHENNGEIHFHDDAGGVKAAVPVADMWAAWTKLQHGGYWQFVDENNHSILAILVEFDERNQVEAFIDLQPFNAVYGPTFEALDMVMARGI